MKKTLSILGVLLISQLGIGQAYAALLQTNTGVKTQVSTGSGIKVESDTSVKVGATQEAKEGSTSGESEAEARSATGTKVEAESNENEDSEISVNLEGDDSTKTEIEHSAQVHSEVELNKLAQTIRARNKMVSDVSIENNDDDVAFEDEAKLFWFIPVTLTNHITVNLDKSGNNIHAVAHVNNSFWNWFSATSESSTDLEAKIQNKLDTSVNAQTQINAKAYAQVLEAIDMSIEAHGSAQIK